MKSNIYRDAIEVQNASNLSEVLKSWARAIDTIWEEIHAAKGGTDTFNNHPVNVLFASKVNSLTGYEQNFSRAYEVCLSKQDDKPKLIPEDLRWLPLDTDILNRRNDAGTHLRNGNADYKAVETLRGIASSGRGRHRAWAGQGLSENECRQAFDQTFIGYDGKPYGIGDRIELHPDTDLWMRGARYGKVTGCTLTPDDRVHVRLDKLPDAQPFAGTEDTFKKA